MIRTIVVDDETPAREELIYILEKFNDINVIGEACHGIEALELNDKLKPDLIFLDIQMPKLNGIEVARKILDGLHRPYIVFVTAYEKYALEAFEVNAMDYILKPISEERLEKRMKRIVTNMGKGRKEYMDKLNTLIENLGHKREETKTRVCVHNMGKLIPLDSKEIIYATVEDRNTVIISTKGKFEINYTLSELCEKLDKPTFFRSHKSFLINLDFIEVIEPWFNSTFNVILKYTDIKIPVSRSQSKEFKELMNIN
ncbi:putative Sensory transduction protein LytT [[Clostridium] ultunense Esp]|uniref:Putative Sensory transduction protein LytT n=1 Tax=[Clostridium] ultunense Esp TaxID=1288971 RepID=M1ZGC4_9FIRM|nr:LytTR family DNA-binding domain-containing protein [Schnuerera ultunensis]CCQ97836.1 putative Sensory transduction protein LytT [[Clostridium] ultunense Esp]SHD77635.1 putative Sensory transduction protein LytT [[Clostridium] ultunense Esp]